MSSNTTISTEHSRSTNNRASRNRRRNRGGPRQATNHEVQEPSISTADGIPPLPGELQPPQQASSSVMPAPSNGAHFPNDIVRGSRRGRGQRSGRGGRNKRGGHIATAEGQGDSVASGLNGIPRSRATRIVSGREFGGHLTQNEGSTPTPAGNTQPGAFPPHGSRNRRPTAPTPIHESRRSSVASSRRRDSVSKSTAPDLPTRIHEDISKGVYECAICTMDLHRKSKTWSCKTCWTVFHLHCVKMWAKNSLSALQQRQAEGHDLNVPPQWRCPGCNLPKQDLPSSYMCWCEKEIDPKSDAGVPPSSCGQTCGKARPKCPHPCDLVCHAGPCPPCTHMGPTQSCFCGKHQTTRKCIETDYDLGSWSCDEVCGDLMPCGEHTCSRPCHEGLCGACSEVVEARCYCGKTQTLMQCFAREQPLDSEQYVTDKNDEGNHQHVESWTGVFDCKQTCGKPFDCGVHQCEKQCHPQDAAPAHCPRSPDLITHCPCGKTEINELLRSLRSTCKDPIPNCDKPCLKILPCGHECQQVCHSGQCQPCMKTVSINCRCRRSAFSTICHQGVEEAPLCTRVCRATLNCGRHDCGERCCPGERKAIERQVAKRKLKPLTARPTLEEIEPEHICVRVCGRPLACGNHSCAELCHKGPCGTCREATFEDLYCNCGRTVLPAPVPCGTKPPPCNYDCERGKSCGHPQVSHKCHDGRQECPPCPYLVEKGCLCGKKVLKNQPCWRSEVSCGIVCGKKLKCGSHTCQKQCHSGPCETSSTRCRQQCGKPKSCNHPCEAPCHAPYPCQEASPCPFKLLITCDCQHLKAEVKCSAFKLSEGNSKRKLKCDDECARLERNRKLALALNIDPTQHQDDHIPYQQSVLSQYRSDPDWAISHENALRLFAADDEQRRLNFKPMKPHQRAFIHGLAEDFGFDSESMDPEPYRHVAVFKTPKFVAAPMKTLAQCVRIQNALQTAANAKATDAIKQAATARSPPYNGFYLHGARFGLTEDELRAVIASCLTDSLLTLQIFFLPHEEIALKASHLRMKDNRELESRLRSLKPALSTTLIPSNRLAESIELCAFDPASPTARVLRRESDTQASCGGGGSPGSSGWSQVAAKSAAPARSVPGIESVGRKPAFTVLGSRVAEAKKRRDQEETERKKKEEAEKELVEVERRLREEVVEDWEVEAEKMVP